MIDGVKSGTSQHPHKPPHPRKGPHHSRIWIQCIGVLVSALFRKSLRVKCDLLRSSVAQAGQMRLSNPQLSLLGVAAVVLDPRAVTETKSSQRSTLRLCRPPTATIETATIALG